MAIKQQDRTVLHSMEKYHHQTLDNMKAEEKHLLEKFENCANEITRLTECERFIDEFGIYMKLTLELLKTQNQ